MEEKWEVRMIEDNGWMNRLYSIGACAWLTEWLATSASSIVLSVFTPGVLSDQECGERRVKWSVVWCWVELQSWYSVCVCELHAASPRDLFLIVSPVSVAYSSQCGTRDIDGIVYFSHPLYALKEKNI